MGLGDSDRKVFRFCGFGGGVWVFNYGIVSILNFNGYFGSKGIVILYLILNVIKFEGFGFGKKLNIKNINLY